MIPCFAGWMLIGWLLRERFVGNLHSFAPAALAKAYLYLLLAFATWFNVVTAPLWNRRARGLPPRGLLPRVPATDRASRA